MGSKYSTQTISGYNASPPSDDGSATASNLITWSKHKTKIGDPIKTLTEAINTALVTAFDYSVRQVTDSTSVAASDHMKTVELAPSTSSACVVTLPDAATMTSNFIVRVKNSSAFTCTISRATGADTIEGTAADISIGAGQSITFSTTTGADGYLIVGLGANVDSGARMLFQQTSAPTGWTKDTTTSGLNGSALRFVTGSASSGGATAFTTVFGSSVSTGSHSITQAELPNCSFTVTDSGHTHTQGTLLNYGQSGSGVSFQSYNSGGVASGSATTGISVSSGGSGTGHTHTMSMDLLYTDCIVATKD